LTVSIFRFVALMFLVTLIPRGQTRVQEKWFSHPQAPSGLSSTGMRSASPRSLLEITAGVQRAIRNAAPGGRFILSSSNTIHSGVPPAHYAVMLRALRQYGCYT
jgi:hypothetical protein